MLKLKSTIVASFARSRARQQLKFAPQLKNYSTNQQIRLQIQQKRHQFEKMPTQKFSSILSNPNPKLSKKFHIEPHKFNQKIKEVYKQDIKMQKLELQDEQDLDYLQADKSHIYDQKQQIQFQEKFQQQLFRLKETKRLLAKKEKNIGNYLAESQTKGQGQGNSDKKMDTEFLEYQENKRLLKNKKINNMMKMNRNNQQLQLLISSGLFNDPNNIQQLVDQINEGKNEEKVPLLQNQPEKVKSSSIADKTVTKPKGQAKTKQLVLEEQQQQEKGLAESLEAIGPEALKNRQNIQTFLENFQKQHHSDKESCLEDLNLLKQIREYEQKVFLERYNAINFRFKGRVGYQFFKESELVSYIKNQNIGPQQLLTMFVQNQHKVSKFKAAIISPKVASTIYSKTSLYKFPESQQNNHINMLWSANFQKLEQKTFKKIHELNDSDYCSVVAAFANNHKDEQGALKKQQYVKICETVRKEMSERIYNLQDQDLGLLCRSIAKVWLGPEPKQWQEIVHYLGKRLAMVEDGFVLESIVELLLCLPENKQVCDIVEKNLEQFNKYKWQEVNTLQTFISACGLVLKNNPSCPIIPEILASQETNLRELLGRYPINHLPQFLTILLVSNSCIVYPQLQKTVNLCKKLCVENIRTQKQVLKQHTIGNLVGTMAMLDYQAYENAKKSKINWGSIKEDVFDGGNAWLVRKLSMKLLVPFQPIPYNSELYFAYHELATLAHKQLPNIPNSHLSKLLQNLSVSRYKNEPLVDQITTKILNTLEAGKQPLSLPRSAPSEKAEVKQLVSIVNCYTLVRRDNMFVAECLLKILGSHFHAFTQQSVYSILRVVTGIASLDIRVQHFSKLSNLVQERLIPFLGDSQVYIEEEIAALHFCSLFLGLNHKFQNVDIGSMRSPVSKFIIAFSTHISQLKWLISCVPSTPSSPPPPALPPQLVLLQGLFHQHINPEMLQNELCMGSPLPYPIVYERIAEILRERCRQKSMKLDLKKWRIEIEAEKTVYFVATYDHLINEYLHHQVQQQQEQNTDGRDPKIKNGYRLYGVWRLYEEYYRLIGWKMKIIVSFLQGK